MKQSTEVSDSQMVSAGKTKRCLVLGGRGFIGSHLVDALLRLGYAVRSFDRQRVALDDSHLANPRLEHYEGDLMCEGDVAGASEGCDVCFHLVSTTLPGSSNADPVFDVETNVLGTLRLLTHVVQSGMGRVVFISSGGTVYGVPTQIPIPETHPTDPICSYGITKLAIEKYLHLYHVLHDLDYRVLRVANLYGEGQRPDRAQGAVAVFMDRTLKGLPIEIWGDGSVVRDYLHISDAVDAIIAAAFSNVSSRVFNVGSGYGTSLVELLGAIEGVTKSKASVTFGPPRPFDVPTNVLCIARAHTELGWRPRVSLEDGLRRTFNWLVSPRISAAVQSADGDTRTGGAGQTGASSSRKVARDKHV